ncbi:hypothetical protein AVEN_133697-1 [Araneus ventricosus]|uniref:Uncharacterized protein n=1 Tax=Araneus ventricosus TaxID=182803 RepID=A0A4Y2B6L7_ARAVE|nr:hypothetical protein AVEN_133697-1 [Araneus ventricosus]
MSPKNTILESCLSVCVSACEHDNSKTIRATGMKFESSGFEECDQENLQDWLECDVGEPDYHVLSDDKIIASGIDDQDSCDDEEETGKNYRAGERIIQ